MAKTIGGHIVGMSTALEADRRAAGRHGDPRLLAHHEHGRRHPDHARSAIEEVIEAGREAEPVISSLLARVIGAL